MKNIILFACLITILPACEKDKQERFTNDNIVGNWIDAEYTDTSIKYSRTNDIPNDTYVLSLKNNYTLIERKNTGWCGTPPISYGNFEGTWNKTDSILELNTTFWGGNKFHKLKIIELTNNELEVKRIYDTIYWEE